MTCEERQTVIVANLADLDAAVYLRRSVGLHRGQPFVHLPEWLVDRCPNACMFTKQIAPRRACKE
jgi:hypothetical protein